MTSYRAVEVDSRWAVQELTGDEWVDLPEESYFQETYAQKRIRQLERKGSRAYYFGTYRDAGHYLWSPSGEKLNFRREPKYDRFNCGDPDIPFQRIDGGLNPPHEVEGHFFWWRKDGWTAIAFANRTDDSRPGSNGAFIFEGDLGPGAAVLMAKRVFPHVIDHFDFELILISAKCVDCEHQCSNHPKRRGHSCAVEGCGCRKYVQAVPGV